MSDNITDAVSWKVKEEYAIERVTKKMKLGAKRIQRIEKII
jgi:hypothetical protein